MSDVSIDWMKFLIIKRNKKKTFVEGKASKCEGMKCAVLEQSTI